MTTTNFKSKLLLSAMMLMGASATSASALTRTNCTPTTGDDTIICAGTLYSLNLNSGNDTVTLNNATVSTYLYGGTGNDAININDGLVGAQVLAQDGNDTITITNGAVIRFDVFGQDGNDIINVTDSTIGRWLYGQDGNDRITLNNAVVGNNIDGGLGDDVISMNGGRTNRQLLGGDGNDIITLTNGANIRNGLLGGAGNDVILLTDSSAGRFLDAGDGNDIVTLTNSNAGLYVYGGLGNDTISIIGGSVSSQVLGQDGNDIIAISGGANIGADIVGGLGNDVLSIDNSIIRRNVTGGVGQDSITITNGSDIGLDVLAGDDNDIITISASTIGRYVNGGLGNDRITITGGADITFDVVGGLGQDTISITNSTIGNEVNGGADNDVISIANSTVTNYVKGDLGDDQITITGGTIGSQVLGGDGDDNISIIDGADIAFDVVGGTGNDEIWVANSTVGRWVAGGIGQDYIIINNSTIGDATNNAGVDGGNDDDIISITNSTISLHVVGGTGHDAITINNVIIDGNISAGDGDDIVSITGATTLISGDVLAGSGDDQIALFGGNVVGEINLGAGDDLIVIDANANEFTGAVSQVFTPAGPRRRFPAMMVMTPNALVATPTDYYGGAGSDNAEIFDLVETDDLYFNSFTNVNFYGQSITLRDSQSVTDLRLLAGSTLTQTNGVLAINGENGGTGTLSVSGNSVVNMQDGATNDRILANYNPDAGSVLAVDVDVTALGYSANDSDYIIGATHTPTSGALVNANIIGSADLSGSRRIVDGSAGIVADPGVGATIVASTSYQLQTDPSTGSRRYWLQDDGSGGTYLMWTTPISANTMGALLGGGALISGSNPSDANAVMDASATGAGMGTIASMSGALGAMDQIGDLASADARNDQSNTRCDTAPKNNAWISGSISDASYGLSNGDTKGTSIGLERNFSNNCDSYYVGAFAYLSESDFDLGYGSASDISSSGLGAYVRGATQNGLYGSVMAYKGVSETDAVNATLSATSTSDTDVSGLAATVGKVKNIAAGVTLDAQAFASINFSDTDRFTDSNGLMVSGIVGDTFVYGATLGLNKLIETGVHASAKVGVKRTEIDATLSAYGIGVDSNPKYTVATGDLGLDLNIGNGGSLRLAGFGELGDDIEVFGGKARFSYKF